MTKPTTFKAASIARYRGIYARCTLKAQEAISEGNTKRAQVMQAKAKCAHSWLERNGETV